MVVGSVPTTWSISGSFCGAMRRSRRRNSVSSARVGGSPRATTNAQAFSPSRLSGTATTAAAIRALQSAHGASVTGELLLGSVVFHPGPVRVTSVTPTVGQTVMPGPVLAITSTARQVKIALDASQQASVKVGDQVTITLPDNQTTPGRITYVSSVATTPSSSGHGSEEESAPTIEVDATPTDPGRRVTWIRRP